MATLGLLTVSGRVKAIRLLCPYEQRQVAKEIPGSRWNARSSEWRLPASELTIKEAMKAFPQIGMTQECRKWYDLVMKRRYEISKLKSRKDADLPWKNALVSTLFPYQRVDIDVARKQRRILLAGDMGTGKTVTALVASELSGHKRVLIICKLAAKWTWGKEIEKWLGSDDYIIVDGDKKKRSDQIAQGKDKKYTIINHDTLLTKVGRKFEPNPELLQQKYDLIIVDEAHRYKNRKTKRTKVAHQLAKNTTDLYLLTGTPIKSKALDLWSLLHMINPERFSSYWAFVLRHHKIEETAFGIDISDEVKDEDWLNYELEPFMVRRMKIDPEIKKYLPDKLFKTLYVDMTTEQRKLYKSMQEDMEIECDGETHVASTVLAMITRLRQISIAPGLVTGKTIRSPKFDAVVDLLQDINGKVVIFSMFKSAIRALETKLTKLGYICTSITGDIPANQRPKNQDYFNKGPAQVMLATIDAAGESIDFTSSSVAVFLDRHWNPSDNEQAEDRLYRMGQKDNVTIVKLIVRDSIEEWMDYIESKKQTLIDAVINKGHDFVRLI